MNEQKILETLTELKIQNETVKLNSERSSSDINDIKIVLKEFGLKLSNLEIQKAKEESHVNRLVSLEQHVDKIRTTIQKAMGVLVIITPVYVGLISWALKQIGS